MTTLTPAYGRDYKSKAQVIADWEAGKDFIIADISHPYDGRPASIRDFENKSVQLRYDGLRKVCVTKS